MMGKVVSGVDIGGTKISVCIASIPQDDQRPEILARVVFSTQLGDAAPKALREIEDAIRALAAGQGMGVQEIDSIGISCGGPVDSKNGLIQSPPNLYGWHDVPIVQVLGEKIGRPVHLQNDANACALAEWRFGAGRGTQNMVFLTMGTGMGAGLILGGRLYQGTNGMAGEVGHVRLSERGPVGFGKEGSFEGFCSGGGIAQIARTKALEYLQVGNSTGYCPDNKSLGNITAKTVADAADGGDRAALDTYRQTGVYLGRGLSILMDILNPELIVIGSIFVKSRDLLWQDALDEIKREALALNASVCRVVPAELGSAIGDFGAVTVALHTKDI